MRMLCALLSSKKLFERFTDSVQFDHLHILLDLLECTMCVCLLHSINIDYKLIEMHDHELGMNLVHFHASVSVSMCMCVLHINCSAFCRILMSTRKIFCSVQLKNGWLPCERASPIEYPKQIERFAISLHFSSFYLVFHDKWLE